MHALKNRHICQSEAAVLCMLPHTRYNSEPWIESCLRSVFQQAVHVNRLRVVIADDVSTDGTMNVVQRMQVPSEQQHSARNLEVSKTNEVFLYSKKFNCQRTHAFWYLVFLLVLPYNHTSADLIRAPLEYMHICTHLCTYMPKHKWTQTHTAILTLLNFCTRR